MAAWNFKNTIIIFGGVDAEEQAARAVARAAGCVLATATLEGVKVHGGNAYCADGYIVDEGDYSLVQDVIIFECSANCGGSFLVVGNCDHHNPGDHGYSMGADQYWEASSLGQLCIILGAERTHELELIAAGDHCPADAYKGNCPGVDPEEFLHFRIVGKVAFYASNPRIPSKTEEEIRADILLAQEKLATAPSVNGVRDLREAGKIEELPEAALSIGEAYMATLPDTDREGNRTGNTKIVLGGHTTPETVERFMGWGNSLPNRVGDAYGNPTRGFAGVVVKG